jgi:uncharacterized membrane protein HdeD (DUF308 family)
MKEILSTQTLKEHRTLIIVEGILFLLLGIAAIALPVLFTLGFEQLIGFLFVWGGLYQAYRAYKLFKTPYFWPSLLMSILALTIGFFLILKPMAGIISLTLLLITFFLIEGVFKMAFALSAREYKGWGWILFSGIISILMAGVIISGFPGTAFWILGLLVGINMLFFGSSLLALAYTISQSPVEKS